MDKKSEGFTLVEIIVVISILVIITAVAAPSLTVFLRIAEERVCADNRKTVQRLYSISLLENDIDDISVFDQFLIDNFKEVCPDDGVISYEDDKVKCSVHEDRSESYEDDPLGDEVPWL